MYCKKCGAKLDEQVNFCPYCGDKVSGSNDNINQSSKNQIRYEDDYTNSGIEYADDIKNDSNDILNKNKDYKSLIGFIISIISVPLCFIHIALGLSVSIIGFILVILGYKKTNKGLSITSLVFSIISLVLTIIVSIFIFVSSFEMTLDNGYTTTIGNYFKDIVDSTMNSDRIKGYWISESNEVFYLAPGNTYYLYLDKDNLEDNYIKSSYSYEVGYVFDTDEIYSDDDYHYYRLHGSWQIEKYGEDENLNNIVKLFREDILLKMDKKNYNKLIVSFPDVDAEIELQRYKK